MQRLFTDTRLLDAACRERYGLTEDVMMENAAADVERHLRRLFGAACVGGLRRRVLVLCGSGNNGADGYALARRLAGNATVVVAVCAPPKSPLCMVQAQRARAVGVPLLPLDTARGFSAVMRLLQQPICHDAIVDCIFGSGFHGVLDASIATLLRQINALPTATMPTGNDGLLPSAPYTCASVATFCCDGSAPAHGGCNRDGSASFTASSVFDSETASFTDNGAVHGDGIAHAVNAGTSDGDSALAHGGCNREGDTMTARSSTVRFRIACDVPTGVHEDGTVTADAFRADLTVTMGALKLSLYSDAAKDIVGNVVCGDLGVSRQLFEQMNHYGDSKTVAVDDFTIDGTDADRDADGGTVIASASFADSSDVNANRHADNMAVLSAATIIGNKSAVGGACSTDDAVVANAGTSSATDSTLSDGASVAVIPASAVVGASSVDCARAPVTAPVMADTAPVALLLEANDLVLPERTRGNVHKGMFGHAVIASGDKGGAACIAGTAALRFGAGLVTLVRLGDKNDALVQRSPELMTAVALPEKTAAVAVGMGLGRGDDVASPWFDWLCAHSNVPCVIDADACYARGLPALLRQRTAGVVLTPHPKEFQALLEICALGSHSIADCVNLRPSLMAKFCRAFPGVVLLVKGANVMIGVHDGGRQRLYVNPLGTAALATAGSGDVLAGLVCALLAQGRVPLDAACNASLAHALASRAFRHGYALSPLSLIEAVATL